MEIKKGDIVGRISYGKDILFYVDRIIKLNNGKAYVILKGVKYRIEADSPIEDLEKIEREQINIEQRGIESEIKKRLEVLSKNKIIKKRNIRKSNIPTNAVILHVDR